MSDDLPAPDLRVTSYKSGVLLSWTPLAGVNSHILRSDAPDGTINMGPAGGTSVYFAIDPSSQQVGVYHTMVQAVRHVTLSPWSARVAFDLWSPEPPLELLRDRLIAHRTSVDGSGTSHRYAFDAEVFLAGQPAQADRVATELAAAFGRLIVIDSSTGPTLADDGTTLTLHGALTPPTDEAVTFGSAPLICTFTAAVGTDRALRGRLTVSLPAGWTWGAGFGVLAGDAADGVVFRSATLTASTSPGAAADLQFEGVTTIRTRVGVAVDAATAAKRTPVTLRGAVRLDAHGRPAFALTSTSQLDLVLGRAGQDPLTLTAATVTLRTDPPGESAAPGAPNTSTFLAVGVLSGLGGEPVRAEVDLPHAWSGTVVVRVGTEAGFPAFGSVGAALAVTATPDPVLTALRTLPALPGPATINGLTITTDASGRGPTRTEFSVAVPRTPWRIVSAPELHVEGTALALTVTRRPWSAGTAEVSRTTFAAAATGTVTLGGASYPVRVRFGAQAPATVEFTEPARLPALATAAASAGLTDGAALGSLPATLVARGPITLDQVVLDVDLNARTVTGVLPRFRQSQPWKFAGRGTDGFELSDWTVDLSLQRGGGRWSPYGTITGTVAFRRGARRVSRFGLEARIPADAETGLWTFALASGEKIQLPSIGDLTRLLGGGSTTLPTGLASLGSLDIVQLALDHDPAAGQLASLSVGIRQSAPWTIIMGQLVVSDLEASLALRRTTAVGTRQGSGMLSGVVTLGGHSVDAAMIKPDFDADWYLRIAWNKPAVFARTGSLDGFAQLDHWMAPAEIRRYLPATLPLAQGFELSKVVVRFRGTDGALAGFAAQIAVPDLWTVIPGRLSITEVRAEIDADFPVRPGRLTGAVVGTVTVGAVTFQVRAAKPARQGPWEFAGSLTEEVELDLVATANDLSDQAFAVAAGNGSPGALPARITLRTADLVAVPDTGRFHVAGKAGFDWHPRLGAMTLAVEELRGAVDVARTGAPVQVTLAGALSFAGLRTTVGLRLGTAATPLILTGTVAPAEAAQLSLPTLTDDVSGAAPGRRWADVLPVGLTAPAFSSATLWANLTAGDLVLHGRLASSGDAVLLTTDASFVLAVALDDGFVFSRLFPSLGVDDVLMVRDARLIVASLPTGETLSAVAARIGTALAAAAPELPSPVADLVGSPLELTDGTLFTAELDVRNAAPGTLLRSVMEISGTGGTPSIRLFARIDHADAANTLFLAELADIALFGGRVRITHRASLPAVRLAYRPAAAHEFTLDARVVLTLFDRSYGFDVTLLGDDDHLTTAAELAPTGQSVVPFGLPGTEIDGLALVLRIDYARPAAAATPDTPAVRARGRSVRLALRGRALLGPRPSAGRPDTRLALAAELDTVNGLPALASLTVESRFSFASFLEDCVPGPGAGWGSFVDIALLPGSRIYYYRASADPFRALTGPDGKHLLDGYHLAARVAVRLVAEVTVDAAITVATDRTTGAPVGVSGTLALTEPVDLRFAQLAGSRQDTARLAYLGGPEITFATGTHASFVLATGVNFLGAAFGTVTVGVAQDAHGTRTFTGQLASARRLPVFGKLTCGFTYTVHADGTDRFEIADWPTFTWARDLVDVLAAIRSVFDAALGDGCGALADFAVDQAFRTSWTLTPTVRSDGDFLVFSCTGTCAFTLTGQAKPFLTMDFAPFEARVASATRFHDLPDALASAAAGGAADLVSRLLRDPAKIAIFAGLVFGPRAAGYVSTLLCKGLVDAAAVAAAEAAATALATAATIAAGTAAAVVAVATSVAAAGGGGESTGGEPPTATPTPATPTDVHLTYADGQFSLSWPPERYAGGYEAELRSHDAAGPLLARVTRRAEDWPLQLTHAAPAASLPAGDFLGRVRAQRAEARSDWATRSLTKLSSPAARAAVRDGHLTVTWDGPAGDYEVEVTGPDGVVSTATDTVAEPGPGGAAPQGEAIVPVDDPVAGDYTAQVSRRGGDIPADPGAPATVTVRVLAAPAGLTVDALDGALNVAFSAVPGAADYRIEVTRVDGVDFKPVTSVVEPAGRSDPSTGGSGRVTVAVRAPARLPYQRGVTYAVRVRADRSDSLSTWAARVTVVYLPTPQS
ncbi:hypothetical protein [Pseudofrankia inefficax]|uniref:Uncharacterized protein n=1 Tax=Pseudofrankia inefficax (strain DSM 45817 / CECT 9037 / DDB 130130 / EuI1c) TaxID=298654 RepID=E3J9M7_PSEI1|nr:hypothetical protein [Pseudofrankia inefficax]ADP84530.1 hypothetical protein FraEuI1c_6554 [Pseudofrankia inefficax]